MLTVSDIQRALADCGDGVEVKADGHTLLTAQVEGTDPRYLNLVSQPDGVRLPAEPTLPQAATVTIAAIETPNTPAILPVSGVIETTVDTAKAGDDQDGRNDLI